MSFILQAPLPAIQTTSLLHSPLFSDSEAVRQSVGIKRAMDGTKFSYVKSNPRSKLNYSFTITRMKALELQAFIKVYYRADVRIVNHKGEVWDCNFTSNPFESTGNGRAGGLPGNEVVDITLEFEGIKVS